jgi:hypothetical protein
MSACAVRNATFALPLALAPLTPLQVVARLTAAPVHDQNFVECVDFVALSLRSSSASTPRRSRAPSHSQAMALSGEARQRPSSSALAAFVM